MQIRFHFPFFVGLFQRNSFNVFANWLGFYVYQPKIIINCFDTIVLMGFDRIYSMIMTEMWLVINKFSLLNDHNSSIIPSVSQVIRCLKIWRYVHRG